MLFVPSRHESLTASPWSEERARESIRAIVYASLEAFHGTRLWPNHPDVAREYNNAQPVTGLWHGAAGTMWGLARLHARDAGLPAHDFTPYLELVFASQPAHLGERISRKIDPHSHGYLLGYAGVNIARWRLTGDTAVLDELAGDIRLNIENPVHELMWAAPGTMLCAWFLWRETGEPRWQELFRASADYLFATWHLDEASQTHVWTQALFGFDAIHLGAIHGVAGNVLPLLAGAELLTADERGLVIARTEHLLSKTAQVEDGRANWKPCLGRPRPGREEMMVQICHGAPGVIVGTAPMWPMASRAYRDLLVAAGELVWHAGPLAKPWGLCHGTAGNGYALLKLYTLTGDVGWLERARCFAMHAIEQYERMRDVFGCIRTDLFCGDVGLALYLQDCIAASSEFPLLDYA